MKTADTPLLRSRLDGVFRPKSVAIYGISDRTSLRIAENMKMPGVPFYGINPTKDEACGVRCYPSLAECPAVPEMVVMGVGHGRIEAAIEDVVSVPGVRAIITPGLGNEAGVVGPEISARISARVADAGIAMIGPNCMGVATPGQPSPWIGSLHETFVPGPVARPASEERQGRPRFAAGTLPVSVTAFVASIARSAVLAVLVIFALENLGLGAPSFGILISTATDCLERCTM